MKLQSSSALVMAPSLSKNAPQRNGTLYVPQPYVPEVSTQLKRIANDVNTLHDSSLYNKLTFAQRLAGKEYYMAKNAPERELIRTLLPYVNALQAEVTERYEPNASDTVNLSALNIAFIPKKEATPTPELRPAGQRLQRHVEGWVSKYARSVGIPHYLKP